MAVIVSSVTTEMGILKVQRDSFLHGSLTNVSSRGMGALQLKWSVTIATFLSVIDVECDLAV